MLFAEIVRQLNALSSIDGDPDDCLKQANKPASSSEGLSAFTFFHSFIHILSLSHSHFHSLSLSFSYSPLFFHPCGRAVIEHLFIDIIFFPHAIYFFFF